MVLLARPAYNARLVERPRGLPCGGGAACDWREFIIYHVHDAFINSSALLSWRKQKENTTKTQHCFSACDNPIVLFQYSGEDADPAVVTDYYY